VSGLLEMLAAERFVATLSGWQVISSEPGWNREGKLIRRYMLYSSISDSVVVATLSMEEIRDAPPLTVAGRILMKAFPLDWNAARLAALGVDSVAREEP